MTYTVIACDRNQGLLGLAQASSPIAVGARCLHLAAGVGAVATQGNTDPSLGPLALQHLQGHGDATQVLASLRSKPLFEYRQIAVVDVQGRIAVHSRPCKIHFSIHSPKTLDLSQVLVPDGHPARESVSQM